MKKQVNITYLYLDTTVCTRCQGSELNINQALEILKSDFPDVEFKLTKTHVNSIDLAMEKKFISSPTIRIDGKDLPIAFKENNCNSCGDFCGNSVDCRIWIHKGKEYESIPTEMLSDLIRDYLTQKIELKIINEEYVVPDNIIRFFSARLEKQKTTSSCCG